ncbi:uncharacterized protein LOC121865051 [Homarus americanus]|uniref:Uncharacterized protein n=1 Tax=Homarus americanus TaxID=6706 RepID=A0A8J5KEP5_HOMAM|nr:uncharacterized protein LOC121865051 [Homarus americanus]XP_042220315.1 uncharacterized protein LOC121865051 [Homarus americanus]KAG7170113.1 hypothetical protein Hamer_G012349 [Homarus americanus]
MAECENGIQTLSSLSIENSIVFLQELVCRFVNIEFSESCAAFLRELMRSIPPNFHAEFLDKLAPIFDNVTEAPLDKNILDVIDELALMLLSPSITQIDVDKFKFPTRNPSKYLMALEHAKSLRMLISYRENVWKYSLSKFELLCSAVTKMSMLRHLTLRHIKIASYKINELLLGLALNSPHLSYLDLKFGALTDSGLDPGSLEKFGKIAHFSDCIPALLMMKNLQHLNVSETWLTYVGVKAIVKHLDLKRLDAVVDGGYDLQAVVIKDLLAAPQDTPFSLSRTAYTLAHEELGIQAICKACPLLEHVTIQHCSVGLVKSHFLALSTLQHLKKVTLCGLEWLLLHSHIAINEDPMPISHLVTEITMTEPSCADATHLGSLSICFPQVTHLWVLGSQDNKSGEPWDGGRVFTKLTHLYYQGSLFIGDFGRIEREQGLQNVLDVLLAWCKNLRSLTLYTNYIESSMLSFAIRRNGLHRLEELRLGLQHDLNCDIIMDVLRTTNDLRILGRTDWWTSMEEDSKVFTITLLKLRFRNLVVFGLDYCGEVDNDPRPPKNNSNNVVW